MVFSSEKQDNVLIDPDASLGSIEEEYVFVIANGRMLFRSERRDCMCVHGRMVLRVDKADCVCVTGRMLLRSDA